MSVIVDMRNQKAVYWKRGDAPDRYGQFTFAAPVEIDCRWDDETGESITPIGAGVKYTSKVYPDRVMGVGDMLRRGAMESDISEDPKAYTDALAIQKFDQTPNFDADEFLYTAYL